MRILSSTALAALSFTLTGCANLLLAPSMLSLPTGSTYARPVVAASECFVNVAIPAVMETVSERILIRAASTRTEVTPRATNRPANTYSSNRPARV